MSKGLLINNVTRVDSEGNEETLDFKKGVNVITGNPSTGKTVWLNMIDYLLGDKDKPEESFGAIDFHGKTLSEKYSSLIGEINIDGERCTIERHWKKSKKLHTIIFNGEEIKSSEFSKFISNKLEIPIVHYPKGSPWADRTWPELSWRSLMRQIYRKEKYWSDIADLQPYVEQHAVLSQFLGEADKIFHKDLGNLIETTKNLNKLGAQKDQFENILDNITKRMTSKEGGITFATYDSINKKIEELENKITKLMEERKGLIIRANGKISNNLNIDKNESLNLSEERAEILNNIEETSKKRSNIQKRINDLNNLIIKLDIEIKKLKRTKSVGDIFLKIPISHCPACDQRVDAKNDLKKCFLCNQPIDLPDSEDRVKYELKKFQSEKNELIKIITILKQNLSDVIKEEDILKEKLNYIERRLFSVRQKITALLDSRLELIDAERGRVEEQIVNYNRILGTLDYKKEIENKIKELNKKIEVYQKSIEEISSKIDFVTAIEDLEEGMVNYINLLNEPKKRWELGRIKFTFAERNFSFKISGSKWNSLSGTYKIYFLFAYHFGLLSLSHKNNNHYPGFVIIDFLPEPPDELERETRLNYLINPFVELCNNSTEPIQLILAGRGFNTIKNAHIKELNKVWK